MLNAPLFNRKPEQNIDRCRLERSESEVLRGASQFLQWSPAVDCVRSGLFRQLLACCVKHQWHVQVTGRRPSERALQVNLARRVVEQISAANDVRYSLFGVVETTAS